MGSETKFGNELAQAAHNKAVDAHNLADRAIRDIASHEKTCAERYGVIKEAMHAMAASISSMNNGFTSSQTTMQNSINNLSNVSHESIGKWKGISYVSTTIVIVGGLLKITGLL